MNVHMVVRRERGGHKIHSGQVESRMRMALVEEEDAEWGSRIVHELDVAKEGKKQGLTVLSCRQQLGMVAMY